MKNIICTLFFLIISQIGICQEELENCFRIDNFTIEQRNQKYPYDKAAKIIFASFEDKSTKLKFFENNKLNKNGYISYFQGEIMKIYFDSLRKDKSKYIPELFEEKIELLEIQKNELTDLIYNFGNNHKDAIIWGAKCYMPRNAILFFDKNNQLFEFIEICFECNQYKTSSTKVDLNNNCGQKISLLKDLFEQAGIEYGIKKQL